MSKFIKKLFGTLSDKPWQKEQMESDDQHQGKTFDISLQTSAVIVIFGVSTVLFTLVVTDTFIAFQRLKIQSIY